MHFSTFLSTQLGAIVARCQVVAPLRNALSLTLSHSLSISLPLQSISIDFNRVVQKL